MNLAVNARDAMPGGGKLTIATGTLSADQALDLAPAAKPVRHAFLSVADTGTGMDEETRSRVFEPFFTTKEQGKGTGLGLAVVFGIVKQSGGEIHIRTSLGSGTTFTVLLPSIEERPPDQSPEEPAEAALAGSETVLLVEDEPPVLRVTARMLRENGYEVLEASHPEQALELARLHPGRIDLVLTDVVMPGMAGPALSRLLAPLRPSAKVLFMTGYVDPALAEDPLLSRGSPLLRKPLTNRSLLQAVRRRLDAP
ncbi:MAG: response regulator [Elusimicrobia bacterium]|nr:response regulator [Elusimicrobiota bacterium]